MNHNLFEQFGPLQQASVDSAFALGSSMIESLEQIATTQFEQSWDAIREGLAGARGLFAVKDSEGLAAWSSSQFQPSLDRLASGARQQAELVARSQKALGEAVQGKVAELTGIASSTLEQLSKDSPQGFEHFFSAAKSLLAAQTAALENVSKVTTQISDMAEANVSAMNDAASQALKAAAESVKQKAA
ncbi:MAG: phasin family protein [Zoogloea sp.]|nr:phasin family protein [Zoogloea sp.]